MNYDGTDPAVTPSSFADALKAIVKEALVEVLTGLQPREAAELLDPEELARKLKVPVSWVYEQSRQDRIPTHRIGRYVRFDLAEVLASQKKK
jgi:excisionase family DNA binding protein